jgi:hypothetical protein
MLSDNQSIIIIINARDHVTHPDETVDKIKALYILTFSFLDGKQSIVFCIVARIL